MTIVLTGASSFLGRAAADCLEERGHRVIRLRHSFEEEPGSLPDTADAWVHFAWAGVGSAGRSDPGIQKQNVEMALRAYEKAAELSCGRFLFAGSQAEYGHAQDGGLKKEEGPAEPVSEYGKAKLEVLRLIAGRGTKSSSGLPLYIHMRLFSVYGPGDHETSLVSSLVRGFLKGEEISMGNCTQLWNYLYIRDAAEGIALLCEKGEGGVYNLAGPDTRPLKEFVQEIQTACGGGRPLFGQRADNAEGPADLSPDISGILALGFAPKTLFSEGLAACIRAEEGCEGEKA